jgi:hypothetical protein
MAVVDTMSGAAADPAEITVASFAGSAAFDGGSRAVRETSSSCIPRPYHHDSRPVKAGGA